MNMHHARIYGDLTMIRNAILFIAVAAAAACVQPQADTATALHGHDDDKTSVPSGATPTYYQDVRPILRAHCSSCHKPGEIGSFSIVSYEDAKSNAKAIASAVKSRKMPPFPPDTTNCQPLEDPRIMSADERALIDTWAARGAPEGDATKPAPDLAIAGEILGEPTDGWDTGVDYIPAPPAGKQDDYHCFIIDPHVTTTVPFHAVDVAASNRAIAHHASVYLASTAKSIAAAKALDDAEPGPGYTCFGGPGLDGVDDLGGWVPGEPPQAYPAKTGSYVKPGNIFILQMHYNIVNKNGPDRSRIRMWRPTEPISEEPNGFDVESYDFKLPPRAANVSSTGTVKVIGADRDPTETEANEGMLWQVGLHQHLLGRAVRMDLVRADGSTQCLLDIPKWEFHWQGSYTFKSPVKMAKSDQVRITCTWDNSTDQVVKYGNTSSDEMCQGWGTTTSK